MPRIAAPGYAFQALREGLRAFHYYPLRGLLQWFRFVHILAKSRREDLPSGLYSLGIIISRTRPKKFSKFK